MKHRHGFTLVELLVSVVIFIGVSVYATATLTTSIAAQTLSKRSQDNSAESSRLLESIRNDVVVATYMNISTASDSLLPGYAPSDVLLVTVPQKNVQTGIPNKVNGIPVQEDHFYCAQPQMKNQVVQGVVLVEYIVPGQGYTLHGSPHCTKDGIEQWLQISSSQVTEIPLSSATFQVLAFNLWRVRTDVGNANPFSVRVQLISKNAPGNDTSDTTTEQRQNGSFTLSPLVNQIVAVPDTNFSYGTP